MSDSGEDIGLASDADEIEDYGDGDAFPDQPAADADLSGFAEEAGDEASYGFENAFDTGSFQADEAELRDDLLGDANLQDSGEYTLPEDALIDGPALAEESAGLDPEEIPLAAPVVEGDPAEFASEVSPGLDGYDDAAGYGAGEYVGDDGGYDEGEYAPEDEYGSRADYDDGGYAEEESDYVGGEYAPADEYGAPADDGGYDEQTDDGGYDEPADDGYDAEPAPPAVADDDADKPNRPGQIAKSALDDIFARAKKLKKD